MIISEVYVLPWPLRAVGRHQHVGSAERVESPVRNVVQHVVSHCDLANGENLKWKEKASK
jgi:hypothetical protein